MKRSGEHPCGVCDRLDGPMWEVIREAERAERIGGCGGDYPCRGEGEGIVTDEAELRTIHADINNRIGHSLSLSCFGTKADLDRLGLVLREGLRLRVSDGDLATTGQVRWVPERQEWMIDLDWNVIEELR